MMVAQSPTGELEVLPGKASYTFDGNWKLQNENGLDGYHVSTVHYNYVATVQQRQQVAEKGGGSNTLDYSKLGAGDAATDDGWFSFRNGHSLLFSDMPNPSVRPGYATIMPRLVDTYGQEGRVDDAPAAQPQHLPSLFFMDQISSQLRIIRPLAWNKTEVISQCIGVKGESDKDRESRIRQFEDFFNVSGMGTPTTWWSSAKPSAASRPASSAGATSPAGTPSGSPDRQQRDDRHPAGADRHRIHPGRALRQPARRLAALAAEGPRAQGPASVASCRKGVSR
jgi:phenylpropionate dioxygenase-like ring-hydroxylating dioxygenase large terminal subunit